MQRDHYNVTTIAPGSLVIYYYSVLNAVRTLPLLEFLELIIGGSYAPDLQLQSLRNLQSIKIYAPTNDYFMNIIEPLSLLIANSPNLHTLHLRPGNLAGILTQARQRNTSPFPPPNVPDATQLHDIGIWYGGKLASGGDMGDIEDDRYRETQCDLAANRFYNLCLVGKHTNSLEKLVVEAEYEGGWCLGDQALAVISLCKKLKILEGCLVSQALHNAVKSLIDVTTQLPRIEKLIVHPADLEDDRWIICSYPSGSGRGHFETVTTRLSKCIREYEVTESSEPVPLILVGSRKFMMTPSEGAGSADGISATLVSLTTVMSLTAVMSLTTAITER
ncbi:uncharacterized protein LACBIDRAFT_334804 [Laccaria bicolor S238N-H82]|uniref:Predicted protein n=1 Tax=Laccaria bicolor (strain S238N-H82 / ATCC MYA-4686) TaxID=486041 RepID=B0E0D4_LACBS|nr:uncharacterized protein LACBIDRAFT_334804 [Laccaria bicolor S238N-H82]EDQ99700.1 predicted protein [Laccaria bicolor S238N-H82]|eukprot:XP_001889677.1 predicted protein [Laccaria bicolor S238N-H82]